MNRVYIYIVDIDKYYHKLPLFWGYLSINEQEKAKKYYSKLLTNRYIISHGILRYIISYYANQPASSLEFINNKYGKLFLKNSNIQFNMSHSHNMVCYVITFYNKVGIDIEFHDHTFDIAEIAKFAFTDKEIKFFKSLSFKEQYKTFYTFWSKKEALVKAVGKGLFYPISTIETIGLLSGKNVLLNNQDNTFQQKWYCYEVQLPKNYSGAIGIENRIDEIVYLELGI